MQCSAARPSLLQYWYRQSPDHWWRAISSDSLLTPGIVTRSDPPTVLSGMINLELDPQGRLTYFQAIPPQKQDEKTEALRHRAAPFDWNILFRRGRAGSFEVTARATGLDFAGASDTRMAWTGAWPGTTRPLRVEAAAFHGKPVFFR